MADQELELINNNLDIVNNLSDRYNNFPLNLLPEINQLATTELLFLFFIFLCLKFLKIIYSLNYKINPFT